MITDTQEALIKRDVLHVILLVLAFASVLLWGRDLADLLVGWWGGGR